MTAQDLLQKLFRGGNDYRLTRFVILRLLGFVYAVAFLVAAQQLVPLVGEHGLTPASHFLAAIESQLGSRAAGAMQVPTLFWFSISDEVLSISSWIGFALSLPDINVALKKIGGRLTTFGIPIGLARLIYNKSRIRKARYIAMGYLR